MAKTLHYDFVNDRSLVAKTGPTLSITRTTDATYLGADGNIATASSGEARFPYDINAQSLGLLVEEARTNICLQSEDFGTTWSTNQAAINTNQTIAPDGSLTADQLIDDGLTGTTNNSFVQGGEFTVTTSTAYTYSCFMKADQLSIGMLRVTTFTTPADSEAWFDLSAGTVGTVDAGFDDSGIEDYGNGWYRCWVSFTTDAADTGGYVRVSAAESDGSLTITRDGTSSIFVWGAQLEAGAFPTSYIPTTTGSVTRNLDAVFTTDVSWYTDGAIESAGMSIYEQGVSLGPKKADTGNWPGAFNLNDGAFQSDFVGVFLDIGAFNRAQIQVFDSLNPNYAIQCAAVLSEPESGTEYKLAAALKTGDNAIVIDTDGTLQTSSNASTNPTGMNRLDLYYDRRVGASSGFTGLIKEIAYWDERLDDATLEEYSANGLPADAPRNPYYIAPHKRTTAARPPRGRRGRRGGLRDL